MSHSYTYDPLYRLTSATGTYTGANNKTASYSLSMGYDNMHRITSKKQHLSQVGVQFDGTLHVGYDLTYTYGQDAGKKFQLDHVRDINYRTEEVPTESTNIKNGHKYTYDANGNLVYINTSRVKKHGREEAQRSEKKYLWDEENRLLAVDENGFVSNYWYDADGERTVKTSGENEALYVNSEFSSGRTGTTCFSLYVSPYLVTGREGHYTKHIYIGSQRIASKVGDLDSYGADPRRISYAGNEADGITIDYKGKYALQLQSIKDRYKAFEVPYHGADNNDYVYGKNFYRNDATREAARAHTMGEPKADNNNFKEEEKYEHMQYYYHPDHLGSSSYITNLDGEVSQHIEYVPFGEVFIEERNNIWDTPYLFNAKELDEETGLYYYGARYYDPRLSLWMSVDPLQEKSSGVSTYTYCLNNPVKLIDPDGEEPTGYEAALMAKHVYNDDEAQRILERLMHRGWKVSDVTTKIRDYMNQTGLFQNGLQSQIYERTQNGATEYVLAFAGTNSITDAIEDISQVIGASSQYNTGIIAAMELSNELNRSELTFVGHSLGGGLAAASSMKTGRKAITFNRASVSLLTKLVNSIKGTTDNTINYQSVGARLFNMSRRIGGDPLTNFQDNIGVGVKGRNIPVPTGLIPSHSIDAFLDPNLFK